MTSKFVQAVARVVILYYLCNYYNNHNNENEDHGENRSDTPGDLLMLYAGTPTSRSATKGDACQSKNLSDK